MPRWLIRCRASAEERSCGSPKCPPSLSRPRPTASSARCARPAWPAQSNAPSHAESGAARSSTREPSSRARGRAGDRPGPGRCRPRPLRPAGSHRRWSMLRKAAPACAANEPASAADASNTGDAPGDAPGHSCIIRLAFAGIRTSEPIQAAAACPGDVRAAILQGDVGIQRSEARARVGALPRRRYPWSSASLNRFACSFRPFPPVNVERAPDHKPAVPLYGAAARPRPGEHSRTAANGVSPQPAERCRGPAVVS